MDGRARFQHGWGATGSLSGVGGEREFPPFGWHRDVKESNTNFVVDQFAGAGFCIGHFQCPPAARVWKQENAIGGWDIVVVPRRVVEIDQRGRKRVIATSNRAVFYNAHQVYQRRLVDPRGDDCVFFALERQALLEILQAEGVATGDGDAPFRFADAPILPRTYLRYHRFLAELRSRHPADGEQTREDVLQLARELVRPGLPAPRGSGPASLVTARRHEELAVEIQRLVGRRFAETMSLERIAKEVGTSPYHAARVFRDQTGQTVHEYRTTLRLHTGLRQLLDPAVRLVDLALDLGFSSHGHFTNHFRRAFGCAPSTLRQHPGRWRHVVANLPRGPL